MNQFYWQSTYGNFGDDLNEWIWDDLLPGWREWRLNRILVGVGTILNKNNFRNGGRYLVCGSGAGFGSPPDVTDGERWRIAFVRGPHTASLMNISQELAISDPAVVIPRIKRFSTPGRLRKIVFIPHCHSDASPIYEWKGICARAGVEHISPRRDSHWVIRAITSAERVITESMHGAIIADAFRIPWKPVSLVDNFNSFKWKDWTNSLNMDVDITVLPRPVIKNDPVSHALLHVRERMSPFPAVEYRQAYRVDVKRTRKRLVSAIESIKTGDFYLSNENELLSCQDRIMGCLSELRECCG